MSRKSISHVAMLAAILMGATKGIGYDAPPSVDREPWRRKKWRKGPSAGPGGPTVRLKIPHRRKP